MRGYGLSTPRTPMRWSERVALVSRELSPAERAKAVDRFIASISTDDHVARDPDDSPLGEFVKTRKIHRRPLHNHRGRMRHSNG